MNEPPLPAWLDPEREVERGAVLSDCGRYRYLLTRRWSAGPLAPFILLNPSTADGTEDDATIRRCMGFAERWGFAGIRVGNVFAYRDTNPDILANLADPIGVENPKWIVHLVKLAREEGCLLPIVCGWGPKGGARDGHARMVRTLRAIGAQMACLGTTRDGYPCHPLYLRSDLTPQPYDGETRVYRKPVSTARIFSLMDHAGIARPPSTQA